MRLDEQEVMRGNISTRPYRKVTSLTAREKGEYESVGIGGIAAPPSYVQVLSQFGPVERLT